MDSLAVLMGRSVSLLWPRDMLPHIPATVTSRLVESACQRSLHRPNRSERLSHGACCTLVCRDPAPTRFSG